MLGVVHLVWGPLGPAPLVRFLDSYRAWAAGADHELVLVWNGTDAAQRERLGALAADLPHRAVVLDAPVQDLAAYRAAADALTHDRLLFLNSHSQLRAADWLAKLDAAFTSAGRPALVGATGSWMSVRTTYAHLLTGLGGTAPTASRRAILAEITAMNHELAGEGGVSVPVPLTDRLTMAGRRLLATPGFPNAHIRTNGFLVDREQFRALVGRGPRHKLDAYGVEAGGRSLTRQVLAAGGAALVVDAAGDVFDPARWDRSRTFWQADQSALLLSDNQTRLWDNGGARRRAVLSGWAWGGAR